MEKIVDIKAILLCIAELEHNPQWIPWILCLFNRATRSALLAENHCNLSQINIV